jgi:hypothetical protein
LGGVVKLHIGSKWYEQTEGVVITGEVIEDGNLHLIVNQPGKISAAFGGAIDDVIGNLLKEGFVREVEPDDPGLLTKDEQRALELSGELANLLHKIITEGGLTESMVTHDWREGAEKIHALQHMIMSQAAARAYPHKFRLLGGKISQ